MAKLRVDKIAAPIVKDEFTGSVHFDGTGDYLSVADHSDLDFGTGDFTIEFWAYAKTSALHDGYVGKRNIGSFNNNSWRIAYNNTYDNINLLHADSGGDFTAAAAPAPGQSWSHYAFTRQSGTLRVFKDGVLTTSATGWTYDFSNIYDLLIGANITSDYHLDGYISNLRICKGHAVYTGNFTVPTRELEVHTGAKGVVFPAADNRTVLLACQSSTDATADSSGRHIITANGNVTAADANPGLFRKTNITSTITENTGSVFFDGNADHLKLANSTDFNYGSGDFSIEVWVYLLSSAGGADNHGIASNYITSGNRRSWLLMLSGATPAFLASSDGTSGNLITVSSSVDVADETWTHIAVSRTGTTLTIYVNGVQQAQNSSFHSSIYSNTDDPVEIGGYNNGTNTFEGYISNLRICKGHQVYKSNFIPPTRELEVHEGPDDDRTVLLACYDGENIFAEKTGRHVLMAYGDRTSSPTPTATDSPIGITTNYPPVTRNVDPVEGPTFGGGAGFVSQNWLTLPKGTTAERMPVLGGVNATSARGVFGGGYSTSDIEYIQISTLGNSSEFGDRAHANLGRPASLSSSTRGLFAGGFTPNTYSNTIDYITITSTGNGKDFGDMTDALWSRAGCSNSIRGIIAGGSDGSNTNLIEHLTISSTGNGQDFGDLTRARRELGGSSSTTRGIFMGGRSPVPSGQDNNENIIDYITIATTGNAVDFGDLTVGARTAGASCSNATRSLYSGGNSSNTIEFVTIATLGNSTNFGDMNNALNRLGSCASSTRGIIAGGSPTNNTIEYVTIASAGDATNFGDLSAGAKRDIAGLSNGHGGLG